ncbi:hypothetical protein NBRC10512v2_003112 [Rhodotorula toruloides]|uniref:RHTO0S08e04060g1_1 n=2 Tax=Rhodotorula toruloides TaxID=5286 RepID=A0A061B1H7_RHOTO|nr:uncharacterized protein RHTO_01080 [Rhodotorula toruloides NP11]EMS22326.1 hypothetical protein RHTO_01080 [Rhodotorula toruloides NP11]CDR43655.1 RHTO0S08e04060g1_1 [Rhodotorula toruloides]
MSRPLVSTNLATCCSVLSLFGFLILGAIGTAFNAGVEVLLRSEESPEDGHAVAVNCWFASLVYLAFAIFCTCQIGANRRYQRGAVRL